VSDVWRPAIAKGVEVKTMDAQAMSILIGVGGGVVVVAGACLAVLARIGAGWREACEEWAPDEVGATEE
jgi:hypothetical protein